MPLWIGLGYGVRASSPALWFLTIEEVPSLVYIRKIIPSSAVPVTIRSTSLSLSISAKPTDPSLIPIKDVVSSV